MSIALLIWPFMFVALFFMKQQQIQRLQKRERDLNGLLENAVQGWRTALGQRDAFEVQLHEVLHELAKARPEVKP